MRSILCGVVAALLASTLLAAEPNWKIVVNFGPFASAQQAADSQAKVNWFDADPSDDTVCTEAFAATELRRCLCKMTGRDAADTAEFALVDDDAEISGPAMLVGSAASNNQVARRAEALKLTESRQKSAQRFRIASMPNEEGGVVALAGDDRVGTLYAVYTFLDYLGVRWFAPGETHEEVPRVERLDLQTLNITDAPAFTTRGFWAWEDRGGEEFVLWMARNRMNLWTVGYHDPATLKKLGLLMTCGGHQPMPMFVNPTHEFPYRQKEFSGNQGKPPDPYPAGEGTGDVNADGKLTYAEAHPEWFGWQDGKRSFKIKNEFGDNFCTSNPSAVAEFIQNLVVELTTGGWKWADRLQFFMLDGGRWCTCEACTSIGSPNDRNILLANQIRKALVRERQRGQINRDVSVVFSCYTGYLDPPIRPLPEDFDYEGCIAGFYPIRRCFSHTLASADCQELNAVVHQKFDGWFLGPQHQYKGAFFVGEYYNISRNKNLPSGFSHSMAIDLPYYYRAGARHMDYMHVPHTDWGTRALTNFQFARMLWNPNLDVESLRNEYFQVRYGAAADRMREFYDRLELALSNSKMLKTKVSGGLASGSGNLFPTRHHTYEPSPPGKDHGESLLESVAEMRACRELIDAALAMNLPARILARIADDAELFAYGESTIHFYNHMVLTDRHLREGKEVLARQEFAKAAAFAAKLEADTKSSNSASAHANAPNGLAASYDDAVFKKLERRFASP